MIPWVVPGSIAMFLSFDFRKWVSELCINDLPYYFNAPHKHVETLYLTV